MSLHLSKCHIVGNHILRPYFQAATTIKEMTQHMPWYIFNRLASNTKVGVFTKEESLTVFPEFTGYAAPAGCSSSSKS